MGLQISRLPGIKLGRDWVIKKSDYARKLDKQYGCGIKVVVFETLLLKNKRLTIEAF